MTRSGGLPPYRLLVILVVCVFFKVNSQVSPTPSPCLTASCLNGATCVVKNNEFVCLCTLNYTGEFCQYKKQKTCQTNPCQNGGLCRDENNGYSCFCQGLFTGKDCEIKPDLFEPLTRPFTTTPTTQYGCTCVNGYCSSSGYCVCYPGFTGQDCKTNIATTLLPTSPSVTPFVDGASECSRRVLDCSKPITDYISTGDMTDVEKLCSLSSESIQCIENQETFCSQYTNITGVIRDARHNYNISCGQGKQCMLVTSQCTSPSIKAADLLTNLQQNGENITPHLLEICSLLNKTNDCLDRNIKNITDDDCRKMLEMNKNATKMSTERLCNPCFDDPCLNGGSCIDLTSDYQCICQGAYYGKMCEFNKNSDAPCGSEYCQHGGFCRENNVCQCVAGYSGPYCQYRPTTETTTWPSMTIGPEDCRIMGCLNGGTCDQTGACICAGNFYGRRCEYIVEYTTTLSPVSKCNGGYCQNEASCWSTDGTEYCHCLQGYTGKYCEHKIGETTAVCVDQVYKNINISQISNITYFCSVQKQALACFDGTGNMTDLNYLQLKNLKEISCAKEPVSCVKTYISCNRQTMEANVIKNNNPRDYDKEKVCSLYNESASCVETKGYNSSDCPRIILLQLYSLSKSSESSVCNSNMTTTQSTVEWCNGGYCKNGGSCIGGSYCSCYGMYSGKYCEYDNSMNSTTPPMEWCYDGYCKNGGRCIGGRYCSCSGMYTGKYCENYMTTTQSTVEWCNGGYCKNGGSCIAGSYCSCYGMYSGKYCEYDNSMNTNECGCENYGSCINGTCYCMGNWVGTRCEEYQLNCPPGVEKVNCFIDPCIGQTCTANSSAKCVTTNCGECDYMFVDNYGYNVTCSETDAEDFCTTEMIKCYNEKMSNYTITDLANPDMYCSLSHKQMECFENINENCTGLKASFNSSKQVFDLVCGPDEMPQCFRTLIECTNRSLPDIGSFLQHASTMMDFNYCLMMNQTMSCIEHSNFNASECPSLFLTQINEMTTIYDRQCKPQKTCDVYNCVYGMCDGGHCICDSGFYGEHCDVNVCDYFYEDPCGVGNCTGEVEMGNLCSCPYYREGVLCEVNDYESTWKTCPRRKRLGKYILDILEGRQQAPSQLRVNISSIFSALNASWFQIPDCTSEGDYSGLITEFDVNNPRARNYYCVDKYGKELDSSVGYNTPPNCAAMNGKACESSPCENGGTCQDYYQGFSSYFTCYCPAGYYGKRCEIRMCNSFQLDPCTMNGGKCVGDILSGRLCSCPDGRTGPLCDQYGDDWNKTDCQRINELTVEVVNFLNGSKSFGAFNARDMILTATRRINLTSMLLPICDDMGQPTDVECDIDVQDTSRKACYCLDQYRQRVSAPHYEGLPNCTRNHTGPCPPGVQIYACLKDPCQVHECPDFPYAFCKANYCGGCNAEFYNNDTRVNCADIDSDGCPLGVPMVNCFADPCQVTKCPRHPQAMCRSNYCGGCNADFFMNGKRVNCTEPKHELSWDPPKIIFQSNRTEYFKLGNMVKLYCNTTGHNFSHVWYKDGLKVDYGFPGQLNYKRVILRNGILIINGAYLTDEGRYQCRYGPVVSDYITLRQITRNNVYVDLPLRVTLGQSLKLECKKGNSINPAKIKWLLKHENETIKEFNLTNRITKDYQDNLYFVNVQLKDFEPEWKYVCAAINGPARSIFMYNSYTVTVDNRTAPIQTYSNRLMSVSRTNQLAFVGEEFRMKCIFSGYPAPFVSFRRLNESRRNDTSPQSKYYQNELIITNVTMNDGGDYECYANTEGSSIVSSRMIFFNVEAKPHFMEPPRDLAIMPGDVAVINCQATGIPKPTVQWYINGTSLQSVNNTLYRHGYFAETRQQNTLLTLRHIKVYKDPLVVQCNVSNEHGYLWRNTAISFKVEKSHPKNTTRPGRCPPVSNGTMAIGIEECKVDSDCQQNSFLKCCFNGFGHQCQMPLTNMPTLRRVAPVIVAQSPALVYFISKIPSSIYCRGEGESLRYTWLKDGKYFNFTDPRFLNRVIHNNGIIRNSETLEFLDEGVYQCKVSNENGTAIGSKIELKLATFDNFVGIDVVKTVDIGDPLTLYCNMPRSEPKAKITWILMNSNTSRYAGMKNYSIVNLSNRITMDSNGNLHFVNVRASDIVNGKSYICMGYNSFANIRRFTSYFTIKSYSNVTVRHEPDLQWASPPEPTGIMGEEFSLKCIFSGNPTPEVVFERIDGQPLSGYTMKKSFGLELYFPSLDTSDAGTYRCYAKNQQNRKKRATNIRTFTVAVESKPYYNVLPRDVEAFENENAVFLCRAEGTPKPNITWYINGNMVLVFMPRYEVTGINNEVLRIDKVRLSDKFVIQCNASNEHGSLLMNLYLHVRSTPTTRPGRCPPVGNGTMAIGIEECSFDSDCHQDPSLKCCSNGFGHQCMTPIRNDTHESCYTLMGQCLNGGSCFPGNGSMSYCFCPRRYTGNKCQTWRKLPCDSYPCQNGASCQDLSQDTYSCSCPSSWGKNCERPTHDNCSCGYNKKCVLKEKCEIVNGRYFNCNITKHCLLNSEYDPCIATTCPRNSECYIDINSRGRCSCRKGFSGPDCSINDAVCDRLMNITYCAVYEKGTCVGDLENGNLCSCRPGSSGPFCEDAGNGIEKSKCEKKKELFDLVLREKTPRSYLIRELMNSTWIPLVNCTPEGYFTPKQCFQNLNYNSTQSDTYCKCVNIRGDIISDVKTYSGHDSCTVPDSQVETAQRICSIQMAKDLCWNGGRCKGDIFNGRICECSLGYSGLFCHKPGFEEVDEQSLCELNRQAFDLITQFTNSSSSFSDYMSRNNKVDETARRFLSVLEVYLRDPMSYLFNDSLVPKAECAGNGDFEPVQCIYNVTDMSVDACYCAMKNGTVIPGTRVMSPNRPTCERNESVCDSLEYCSLPCENGYQHDMSGCPICACKSLCSGKVCTQGSTCRVERLNCSHGTGPCQSAVCVPDDKVGQCPNHQYSNMTFIINKYLSNYECTNECRNDSDCYGDMVCCGMSCGSQCMKPLGKGICKNEKMKMKQEIELFETIEMLLRNQSALDTFEPWVINTMRGYVSKDIRWKPTCVDDDTYLREQCYYNYTGVNRPVYCQCMTPDGTIVHNSKVKVDNSTISLFNCQDKPGICPMVENGTFGMAVELCSNDYECLGSEKCCSNGAGHVCRQPVPKQSGHLVIPNICRHQVNVCQSVDRNAKCIGDWENGNLCVCSERSGLLCKKPFSGRRKMTGCEQREKLSSILYNVTHRKPVEPGYNEIVNFIRVLQIPQLQGRNNMTFTLPKCHMTDGSYRNYQCDQYLFGNKTKDCYCVNERGHKFMGSEFKPGQEPKCTGYQNPNTVCSSGIGSPLGNGKSYVQCNYKYDCPSGYECNFGRAYTARGGYYTNGYCCLKQTALENRCNITVDRGVMEEKCRTTRYHFNSGLQKCVRYNSSKCGSDVHKVNSFYTLDECDNHCMKNIKSGSCPRKPPMYAQTKNCQNQCQEDGDCSGAYKCCETSCAKKCILSEDVMHKDEPCSPGVKALEGYNCGRGGSACPSGYYCDIAPNDAFAACCPDKPQDICSMKQDSGPCKAYMPRWYFNIQTRQCEEFIYGGCAGNDNNFMSREECCNSCGADDCKEGQCPSVKKSVYASCDVKCKTDADCAGGSLCCSNGCGRHCFTPTKNANSTCFRELEMVNLKLSNKIIGQCSTMMIPRCNMDGSWNAEQCMDNYGLCWCVTKNGTKIPDTTVSGRAQCGFTPKPGSGVPDSVYIRMDSCSNSEAKIIWEAPRNDNGYPVDQYLVLYRVHDDSDQWYTKEVSPNSLGTTIRLYPGLKYSFVVQARNRVGLSKIVDQNVECATPPARPLINPTNITSITNKHGALIVTWEPVPILYQGHHESFGYIINAYKEGDDEQSMVIKHYDKNSRVFEMPTQNVFSNFIVLIKSRNNLGNAPMEAKQHRVKSFEDTPLVIPEILMVDKIYHNSAIVNWAPIENTDDIAIQGIFNGFQVQYWRNDQGYKDMVKINVTSGNTLKLNGLLPATGYKVQVAVRNTHYVGQASPEIEFSTLPGSIDPPIETNSTKPNMTSPTSNTNKINICPAGESVHCCSADLCKMSVCTAYPSAVCRVNPCGGCSVVFYDYDNNVVNCTKGLSMCEKRRHAAVKARYQHAFNNMTNIYPIVVVGNKTIRTDMKMTPTNEDTESNDNVCSLPPVTGMCRAYIPRWYFNPATSLCEKFIYGGCGGNENSFDRPEECYKRCSPEDSPCKVRLEIPCANNEVCQIVTDPDCYTGACRQAPQCIKQHEDPHIEGVYVPDCTKDNNYEYKQCQHNYCWCVSKDGDIFNTSITRGPLTCSETGQVYDSQFDPEVCTNGSPINMGCLDVCQNKLCPDYPDATCTVDLCSTDCKVKFVNKTNHEVACGNDICKVVSAKPHKDCLAPVVCPGQETPKICPVDVCEKASCNGNPCALCSIDPCTCKPVFVDIMSNITITDCSIITYTMCRMEYCNQLKEKNRAKSMGQDSDILLLSCDSTGRYNSKQCDSARCWCVNGKGQWTKDLKSTQDTCLRNETLEVTVQMKFQQDFSKVENNLAEFEAAVLELMKKWYIDEYVKSITIRPGSVIVETKFGNKEEKEPAPILGLIPNIVQNRLLQNDAVIEWEGEKWTANSDYISVDTKFESQTGESTDTPTTEHPVPTPEPGMDDKLIIVISVICGVFGAAVIAIVVWACCCLKKGKKEVKDTYFTDMNSERSTPPPPFGVSNQTYMNSNILMNSDQYIGDSKPTLHTFGNKPVEEEQYENDVIKVKF